MATDFLSDDNKMPQSSTETGRDFLSEPDSESYWESVKSAPGKIIKDLGGAIRRGYQSLPGYYEKSKTEIPGFFNIGNEHAAHFGGQALAGANELINSLAQFPLNVSKYGSERLNLTPQGLTNFLQRMTPEDTTQAINQLFGEPKYPGEAMLRGAVRNAPFLYGAKSLSSSIKPSAFFTTNKSIKNELLKTHDALENRASDTFKKVSDEVNNRGINKIPLNSGEYKKLSLLDRLLEPNHKGEFLEDNSWEMNKYSKSANQVERELSPFERGSLKPNLLKEQKLPSNQNKFIDENQIENSGQKISLNSDEKIGPFYTEKDLAKTINSNVSDIQKHFAPWEIRKSIINPGSDELGIRIKSIRNIENKLNDMVNQNRINFVQLKSYFPNTKKYNSLLTQAQTGDYNALRRLQTNLYEHGKKNLGSGFEADRMKGAEMLESRNDINKAISDHLVSSGNTDLAEKLNGARKDWRTLQNTYYNENMSNSLVKMFDKNFRKVPKNLVNLLSEESIPMKNLLDFHPGLQERISRYKLGKNILGKTLKYGVPAAGAAFLGYEYGKKGRP